MPRSSLSPSNRLRFTLDARASRAAGRRAAMRLSPLVETVADKKKMGEHLQHDLCKVRVV